MLTSNHPAIAQATRSFLRELLASGDLDEASEELLHKSLTKTRPRSHAGWVYALAEVLGADREQALRAGVFVELACGAIDIVDDVEDGDAHRYLGDLPGPVQINLSEHMLVLSALAAARLERTTRNSSGSFSADAYRLFSAMATGQRLELTTQHWTTDSYEHVALLTCGKQYEMYLRTAAYAASFTAEPLLSLANPQGISTQIACDLCSNDNRLLALGLDAIDTIKTKWHAATLSALDVMPSQAQPILREMCRFSLETLHPR